MTRENGGTSWENFSGGIEGEIIMAWGMQEGYECDLV